VRHGKERMLGLGPLHVVGLAEARQRARQARLQLLDGIDPVADRQAKKVAAKVAEAKTITFAACAEQYQAAHEGQWRNAKHREQFIGTLRTLILGEFALELQREWREERDKAIAPLKAEIADLKGKLDAVAELKGKVDALLTLFQGAKAEVIGLPRKRPSDAA
jgi:hypothetical protein